MTFLTSALGKEKNKRRGAKNQAPKNKVGSAVFHWCPDKSSYTLSGTLLSPNGVPPELVPDVIEEDTYDLMTKRSLDRYWLISF